MRQWTSPGRRSLRSLLVGLVVSAIGCGKPAADEARPPDGARTPSNAASAPAATEPGVVVNAVPLPEETLQQLRQVYPVSIEPGRYWYDAVSGAYGREGQPIAGQMIPGLTLGGALAATASGGTSGVYINGRQITGGEKAFIEQLCQTPVSPGRYWVMATGVGGFEGQPAFFNLAQCPGVPQQSGGGASKSRTYCDANGACTSTGILGSITTAPN